MRIVIDPVVVDRNVSPEYALINNLEGWKAAPNVMFSILYQRLDRLELFHADYGGMPVVVQVLVAVLPVLLVFVFIQIGGKGFPCEDVAHIALVCQNVPYSAGGPVGATGLGQAADILQQFRDAFL